MERKHRRLRQLLPAVGDRRTAEYCSRAGIDAPARNRSVRRGRRASPSSRSAEQEGVISADSDSTKTRSEPNGSLLVFLGTDRPSCRARLSLAMRTPPFLCRFAAAAVTLFRCADVSAQSSQNGLVVANSDSAASLEIGGYYAQQRSIPSSQVLKLPMSVTDEITRAVYVQQIERPIANWLGQNGAQDRIHFIVLTKGVPLRIQGTSGTQATTASVDSELTLLYRKLAGATIPEAGPFRNPYFAGEANAGVTPFAHKNHDIYLVTRLDGFTVSDVKKLIDRGLSP